MCAIARQPILLLSAAYYQLARIIPTGRLLRRPGGQQLAMPGHVLEEYPARRFIKNGCGARLQPGMRRGKHIVGAWIIVGLQHSVAGQLDLQPHVDGIKRATLRQAR
jgi:hypothetical protein